MRGVSLEEIAAATRISTRFLEALEKEQWNELPGGVFNRGFIRSVCKYLGVDEDDMVAEYSMETQQGMQIGTQIGAQAATHGNGPGLSAMRAAVRARDVARWPRKRRAPFAVAVVALVILVLLGTSGWFLGVKYGPALWARMHHQPAAQVGVLPTLPSLESSASAAGSAPVVGSAIGDPSTSSTAPVTVPGADPATTGSAVAPNAASASAAADSLQLKIEAGKSAHVTVFADGKSVFDGTMEPGNTQTFEARDNFQVTSSEASALLLALNSLPMAPMGQPGQPATVMLGHKDLAAAGVTH